MKNSCLRDGRERVDGEEGKGKEVEGDREREGREGKGEGWRGKGGGGEGDRAIEGREVDIASCSHICCQRILSWGRTKVWLSFV